VPARVDLARLLGRVRRRLRLTAALQGAVVGGCAALAVWGVAVIAARWGTRGSGLSLAGATAALLVAGLVGGLVRRIPLSAARAPSIARWVVRTAGTAIAPWRLFH
jgi:hypothetical protein